MAYGLNSAYRENPIWAVFVNKVLLALSHTHNLHIVYGCFRTAKAELTLCHRAHMAPKLKISTIWSLQKHFAKPCTEAFILPLRKRACELTGVTHSLPLLLNTWHTKSRDWILTSISEFSYLFNYISTFTFIKFVALPRSSLGTLHTYSDDAASVLDILGAAL